ncbi:LysR family transcriptional regulator [Apilactobacillus quenuiae]|uniref:LysR family transcriptional regulator n=1 Tax=Apilactobacillus quenuiae TaxID=2008377 RepID=UPI000D01C03A|nr:LysR family transcriptional regulator [Apilactobacillus quenuiae]
MDTRVLEYFIMVAEEKNFTKASKILHVTQPTMSRQINSLEEDLGVKLFIRNQHNLKLTSEGIIFLRRAKEIISLTEKAKDDVNNNENMSGTISIGCCELRSFESLAKVIHDFRLKYPNVKFYIHSGDNDDINQWLDQGLIDIGLFLEPVSTGKYDFIRMKKKEEWGILVSDQSKFFNYESIKPGDLVGKPVITILDRVVQSKLADWSGKYANQMRNWARYNLIYNAAMLAQNNNGVIICLKLNQNFDHLKFIPLIPYLRLSSIIAWQDQKQQSKTIRTFITFIKNSNL